MQIDLRQHERTATDVFVAFSEVVAEHGDARSYEGVIRNCNATGMYISTDHPAPQGRIIAVTFWLRSRNQAPLPIRVRATVRWQYTISPPFGMGVKFLAFEGIDERDFIMWLSNLLGKKRGRPLDAPASRETAYALPADPSTSISL